MKKLIILSIFFVSFSSLSAGVLDSIAGAVHEFGRWDPKGVEQILHHNNKMLDQQIGYLEGSVHIDTENPLLPSTKKSYERTPQEIATEEIISASGAMIKAIDKAKPKLIATFKERKAINDKLLSKMMRMVTDYHLQVKVVKLLREIAAINAKVLKDMETKKKSFSSFRSYWRKGNRGVLKSKVLLALGFSKTEVKQMLLYSEPRADQSDTERDKNLNKAIDEAEKETSVAAAA